MVIIRYVVAAVHRIHAAQNTAPDAQDLIRKILQREPSKRLTIPQILTHPWFANPPPIPHSLFPSSVLEDPTSPFGSDEAPPPTHTAMSSTASDSTYTTFHSAASELSQSAPTTPDESPTHDDLALLHHNLSQSTITKSGESTDATPRLSAPPWKAPSVADVVPSAVIEAAAKLSSAPSAFHNGSSTKGVPPTHPARTPVRTKRRSVSSTLSAPSSPASPTRPNAQLPQDFISTLSTPAPIVFSTPLERELLNNLSALGFDTGQMVHSVLTDACDSSGAIWWMMRKKAERKALDELVRNEEANVKGLDKDGQRLAPGARELLVLSEPSETGLDEGTSKHHFTPHEPSFVERNLPPDLGIVSPTPSVPNANTLLTPPRLTSSPVVLSPPTMTPSQSQSKTEQQQRSNFTSPSSQGNKGRATKPRSGSVSIMQRATTALEAAGLVRKKSDEKFRKDEHDKERDRDREKDNQKAREREDKEKWATSGEESRPSGSSHRLTKSPPFKPPKDGIPTTPENESSALVSGLPAVTSPWVIPTPVPSSSQIAPTPANSPGEVPPAISSSASVGSAGGKQQGRARASILHTFRMWFNEDRKGKRKAAASNHPLPLPHHHVNHPIASPTSAGSMRGGRTKRRSGSGSRPQVMRRGGHQKRPSASSRRSSSVNSRRSSIASVHKVTMDYQHVDDPFNPRRRSFGARTPTSERGSRPSSVRSFQISTPGLPPLRRRSHSPSESSTGSGRRSLRRTDSPLQRYHRRGGSGSSTRVVRQVKTVYPHARSSSAASSHQSAPSSRPGSYHEASEAEASAGAHSPLRTSSSRYGGEDTPRRAPYSTTVLVAQKKQTPFRQPSLSRSSWKKAWGVEPPGWKSRSTEAPFEVLFTDDPRSSVRDVFSGRQSLNLGDDDDWVDEDDEAPFAGGLGQMPASASHPAAPQSLEFHHKPEPLVLSPPPRSSARPSALSKRSGSRNTIGRQKASHSPVANTCPQPQTVEHTQPESRGARRQLPTRAEPAFRGHAIQEEDEDEENE